MGSEDMNLVSSQRMETALNSQRVYQPEHLQYRCAPAVVGPRRGDSGRKTRPVGVGGFVEAGGKLHANDRERYLPQQRADFRSGMYSTDDNRQDGIVVDSDSRRGTVNMNMNMNGGLQMRGMVNRNTGGRTNQQDWVERVAVIVADGSAGSQSEGSDEDEDDDDDGDGEMEGEVEGMVPVDGRQDSMGANNNSNNNNSSNSNVQGSIEGFPKSSLDRDGGIPKTALQNHHTSLGMFLSPPFLNSFSSPSGTPPMLDATSAAQNGGGGVPASSGFYRDGIVKESNNATATANTGPLHEHHQARIPHGSSMHHEGGLPVGSYYTELLHSPGPIAQKDTGVDEGGAYVERKGAAATAEASEPSLRSILSDPLTGALMDDATILFCGHSFGSGGLQHVLEVRACVTCGQTVTNDSIAPNHALRAAVQAYRREEEFQSKSAKRRRDKFDQDKVGFSDPMSMDCSRGKGVQFPFVVNDRVIIKGNKRTPERFVGREAVITTQCLNGWYVVKTLDNAESVKLQYRSLLKVGDNQPSNEISQKALAPSWL
eukprot:Gb_06756 [translate_table: standard]